MSSYSSNPLAVFQEKAGVNVGDQDYVATIPDGTGQAGELTKVPAAASYAAAAAAIAGVGYFVVQVPPTAAQIEAGTTGTKYRVLITAIT